MSLIVPWRCTWASARPRRRGYVRAFLLLPQRITMAYAILRHNGVELGESDNLLGGNAA